MGGCYLVNQKEIKMVKLSQIVFNGIITQKRVVNLMSISYRQTNRIIERVKKKGDIDVTYKSRVRNSKRKISDQLREKIIELYKKNYSIFSIALFFGKDRFYTYKQGYNKKDACSEKPLYIQREKRI